MEPPSTEKAPYATTAKVLSISLLLGVLGDLLIHDAPVGAGASLFLVVASLAIASAVRLAKGQPYTAPFSRQTGWLLLPILGFSLFLSWRDSTELKELNLVSIALLIGIVAARCRKGKVAVGSIRDYTVDVALRWFSFLADAVQVFKLRGQWSEVSKKSNGKLAAVSRGILFATPLLLLFGALFVSADAGFETLVNRTFAFDGEAAFNHLILAGFLAWVLAGFLHRLFFGVDAPPAPPNATADSRLRSKLGITEVGIVLGSLVLLFSAFVATQFRALFGGAEYVRAAAGLSIAEYARRGFFELSWVAAIALVVLVGSHALLDASNPKGERTYRVLATTLVVLVFAIIQSAALKMRLYVDSFGISLLRLYVLAAIGWIGTVFAWFLMTTLRGRQDRFAFGGLALFLVGVAGLNALNPDRLVARVNLARSEVDMTYLQSLSDDAVPEFRKFAKGNDFLSEELGRRKAALTDSSWRGWSLGERMALQELSHLPAPPRTATPAPR